MNERIRLFAEQSNLAELYDRYVEYCMKNADDDIMDYDTIVKKFAEVIVWECVDRIKNADMRDYEGSDSDEVLWLVERQIVKHFGVDGA